MSLQPGWATVPKSLRGDPSELGTSPQMRQNQRYGAKFQFKARAHPTSKLQQKCQDYEPSETNPPIACCRQPWWGGPPLAEDAKTAQTDAFPFAIRKITCQRAVRLIWVSCPQKAVAFSTLNRPSFVCSKKGAQSPSQRFPQHRRSCRPTQFTPKLARDKQYFCR